MAKEEDGRTAFTPRVASLRHKAAALQTSQPPSRSQVWISGDWRQETARTNRQVPQQGRQDTRSLPNRTISARSAVVGQEHQICFVVRHQTSTVLPERGPRKTTTSEVTLRLRAKRLLRVCKSVKRVLMGSATTTPHDGRVADAL